MTKRPIFNSMPEAIGIVLMFVLVVLGWLMIGRLLIAEDTIKEPPYAEFERSEAMYTFYTQGVEERQARLTGKEKRYKPWDRVWFWFDGHKKMYGIVAEVQYAVTYVHEATTFDGISPTHMEHWKPEKKK